MKSLQVLNCCPDTVDEYSDLQVMKSRAGWYVGTVATSKLDDGTPFQEPGSRDTDYYSTKEDAERVLNAIEQLYMPTMHEQSMWAIETWMRVNKLDPRGVGYRMYP